jgi:hypothetical protein
MSECQDCYWRWTTWAGPCRVISMRQPGADCPHFRRRKLSRAEKRKGRGGA